MRRKTLLLGALPQPFEGPWVPTRGRWRVRGGEDFSGKVVLEHRLSTTHPVRVALNGENIEFTSDYARVIVLEPLKYRNVTLEIEEVL
jgi:hypothetical protein